MAKPYHGWIIVGIAILIYAAVIGSATSIFGLFVIPVSAEYGLSRASMNFAYVLISVGSAVLAPMIGPVLDRVSLRPVIALAGLLLGTGFAILGLSHSIWLNMLALGLLIPAGQDCGALLTMGILVARWFKWQLGRAMALSALGMSLGGVVMPPLAAVLIDSVGWRATLLIIGAGLFFLLLLLAAIIRERPGADDVEPVGPAGAMKRTAAAVSAGDRPFRARDLLRRFEFWAISLGISLATGVATANMASLTPFVMNKGLTLMQATSLMSIAAAAAMVGKLALAGIADRVRTVVLLYGVVGLGIPLNLALMEADGFPALTGCAVALGLSTGAIPPLLQTVLVEWFGAASYGTARGLIAPLFAICTGVSMVFAGKVYDQMGSYWPVFATFTILQGCALAALLVGERRKAKFVAPGDHQRFDPRRRSAK